MPSWWRKWTGGLGRDVLLAFRSVRYAPTVSTVAVLSLALGIGANTAIFSIIDSLLLRPLPVAHPERLVTLVVGTPQSEPTYEEAHAFTYQTFEQIRQQDDGIESTLAWGGWSQLNCRRGNENTVVNTLWVSGDFFTTLGVPALLGRTFTLSDDSVGGGPDGPSAVISYDFWQQHLNGAPVVGTSLTIERASVTIVGITPPSFFGVHVGSVFDMVLPIKTGSVVRPIQGFKPDAPWLTIMLRLKGGQSVAGTTAALRLVQSQIRVAAMPQAYHPLQFLDKPFALVPIGAGFSNLRSQYERPLLTVLVIVALVLLIASANIANLLMARHTARSHELSVRLALGASSWRLARQVLVESAVLTIAGTIGGLVLARFASRALVARVSAPLTPTTLDLSLDWRILAFTAAVMTITTLLFGLAPACRAARISPIEVLKEQGRGAIGAARGHMSDSLIVAQVALSLMLLVAGGLFLRTFERLERVSLGFDRDQILDIMVNAQAVPPAERNAVFHRLVKTASEVPGVVAAGGSVNPPLVGFALGDLLVGPAGSVPSANSEPVTRFDEITPGWLSTYGTRVRAGRDIDEHDTRDSRPVMLVNEAFVRHFLPTQDPIGTNLSVSTRISVLDVTSLNAKTIIGVVADTVYRSIREPARPMIYFPLAQHQGAISEIVFFVVVRSVGVPPLSLSRSLGAALNRIDPALVLTFSPVDAQIDRSLAQDRLVAMLSGSFGALGLLLASLGVYGITAYAVARRRTEIGIRMALGAEPTDIVRLVLSKVFTLITIGLVIGGALSLAASRFITSLLYGVRGHDPLTFVAAAIILAAIGAIATASPAWRASRLDPGHVLRDS
jgi:putative ABC transport system permease protein